mgnify:CR=1 FL=1
MGDIFSKHKRSQIMATISGIETKPEIEVRKFLFSKGFRFRKNVKTLLGKPDIVLPKYKTIILIHGCFWHGHKNCRKSKLPTSNTEFWKQKIKANVVRDKKVKQTLEKAGWKVITIWECKLKNKKAFENTMTSLLKQLSNFRR